MISTSECKKRACTNILHGENDSETQGYDDIYDFCNSNFSLHPLVVPSTSYHESDIANASNDYDMCEPYAMVSCHKQVDLACHPLYEVHLVEDIPCEPHLMSGSLRQNQEKHMETLKNFVDVKVLLEIFQYILGKTIFLGIFWNSQRRNSQDEGNLYELALIYDSSS